MTDSLVGKVVLGRYRVVRSLAMGGMGVIYLGRSEGAAGFTKPVVIKRIVPDVATLDADAEGFFIREAAILAQLRDPGIVGVLDFGQESGAYTMVLEYIHGFHLGQWDGFFRRTNQRFPASMAIHIVEVVLSALESAHAMRDAAGQPTVIVHRDVTPSNVLIDVSGTVKLADFGIARVAGRTAEKTASGLLRGKMPYLSPELLDGYAASVASDVYSAGVMLHSLLIGTNEWNGSTPTDTLRLILQHVASSVEAARTDAPVGIDAVLAKALAKNPAERFASAAAFAASLRALALPNRSTLAEELRTLTARDFPTEVSRVLGLEPLASLEAAWRSAARTESTETTAGIDAKAEPPTDDGRTVRRKRPRAEPETSPESAEVGLEVVEATLTESGAKPPAAPPIESSRWTTFIFALAIGLAGVSIWIAARPTRGPHRSPVVVRESSTVDDATALEAPALVATDASVALGVDASVRSGAAARASNSTVSDSDRLTRTFRSHQSAIRACFGRDSAGRGESEHVEIQFEIAASGIVRSASLTPSALRRTPVGACLTRVATRIRFDPLPGPVRVTIPFTMETRAAH